MTVMGWLEILLLLIAILTVTKPLGIYLHRVLESSGTPLRNVFEPIFAIVEKGIGVDTRPEQTWGEYARSLLAFSVVTLVGSYGIMRLQHLLPLNPQGFGPVSPTIALNTAVSFTTNTNWQAYSGESTMSHLSQMAALAWHNFLSTAAGMGVAMALARGLTRAPHAGSAPTLGNFWGDMIRSLFGVLLPLSLIGAMLLVGAGVVQNFAAPLQITTREGVVQAIAMGPVASQEVIKQLGTNGGGFFNANSAHPFENPTPLSNFFAIFLIFALPAGFTYCFGLMTGNTRQGWVLFGVMSLLFLLGVGIVYWAEAAPNPGWRDLPLDQSAGNLEGKEVRFGVPASSLFAVATTDASCGAVNSMHDSFSPLGGMILLLNIQLGEIIFGGVGAGLYGMLVFVVLTVFLAGLMVGRTPEYLGKKIETREIKLATLYILIFPFLILLLAGVSGVMPFGIGSLNNAGPHGLSEILYAYSSATGNNGSAFAGLNAATDWYTWTLSLCMFLGRFWMIIPVLALGGSMAAKKPVPPSLGTFPTDGWVFLALLVSVILIVGALTFLPALSLGPVLEHVLAAEGRTF